LAHSTFSNRVENHESPDCLTRFEDELSIGRSNDFRPGEQQLRDRTRAPLTGRYVLLDLPEHHRLQFVRHEGRENERVRASHVSPPGEQASPSAHENQLGWKEESWSYTAPTEWDPQVMTPP